MQYLEEKCEKQNQNYVATFYFIEFRRSQANIYEIRKESRKEDCKRSYYFIDISKNIRKSHNYGLIVVNFWLFAFCHRCRCFFRVVSTTP